MPPVVVVPPPTQVNGCAPAAGDVCAPLALPGANAAFTVTPETEVESCCQILEQHQVRRLPVVDERGNLCGMIAQADIATALGARIWDTSRFIADDSILGRVLHTLFGYTDRPTELQFLVYLATLALILGLMRVFAPARASPRPRLAPGE